MHPMFTAAVFYDSQDKGFLSAIHQSINEWIKKITYLYHGKLAIKK